jgi:hypothetical protein
MNTTNARPACLLLAAWLLGSSAALAQSAPAHGVARPIEGWVVDAGGHPLGGLMVFAADAETDALVAMTTSSRDGHVELTLPRRRHNFGILSPRLGVVRLRPRGAGFELVVRSLPLDEGQGAAPDQREAWLNMPRAALVRGRALDEAGVGLAGVRLEVVRRSGIVSSAILSGAGGEFAIFLPGGESWVRASAPGLKVVSSSRQDGRLTIVLGVAVEIQNVTIGGGRVLTFRPADSIDPEYSPPAKVRSYLAFAYGICPSTGPLKAHEKRALKRYWYLEVLRSTPPSPATISTTTCTPASQYEIPPGQVNVGGFESWREGSLGAGPE